MSDKATEIYNSWSMVMSDVQQYLYCSWHVIISWIDNSSKIKEQKPDNDGESDSQKDSGTETPNKCSIIFSRLINLIRALNEGRFEVVLDDLKKDFQKDGDLKAFGKCFIENYTHIVDRWAYYYHKNCTINTKMSVEGMHKSLKYGFFNGKKWHD